MHRWILVMTVFTGLSMFLSVEPVPVGRLIVPSKLRYCDPRSMYFEKKKKNKIVFRNVVAFRCQLPRSNKFYRFEPPSDDKRMAS